MASIFDLSKITIFKRKKKTKRATKSRKQAYADKINANLPFSEQWFQDKWRIDVTQDKLDLYQDKYNYPIGKYIPDVINLGYKYIIEVDGSVHNDPIVQWKDKLKDIYYSKKGYSVFRLKAYDNEGYKSLLVNILSIREKTLRQY